LLESGFQVLAPVPQPGLITNNVPIAVHPDHPFSAAKDEFGQKRHRHSVFCPRLRHSHPGDVLVMKARPALFRERGARQQSVNIDGCTAARRGPARP
jgi:hypothetical protein